MLEVVSQWVAEYGYGLVAIFLMIETIGLPIPGETALVTAAALAGRGTLNIVGVAIAACTGTILGSQIGYWIGRRSGARVLATHGKWLGLTEARLAKTHKFFEQYGTKTVALGRFIAFVRSFLGIFAGISGMPLRTFTFYNIIGAVVWVATFGGLGYAFGRNLPRLIFYIGRVSLLLAILVTIVAGLAILWRWFNRNRAQVVELLDVRYQRGAFSARMSAWKDQHPMLWRLASGRSAQFRYLALHLLIGFAASLMVIAVFASITEDLMESSPLTRFDIVVAAQLRGSVSDAAINIFAFLSSLGGRGVMTLLLLAGAAIFVVRRRAVELVGWCAAFVGGALLDAMLRGVVRRSELPFADIVVLDWGLGLASGQALGVVVGVGMLAYLVVSMTRNHVLRATELTLAILLATSIVVGRLYLGQHFVSDATAGVAAGLLWLATCITGIEIARQREWRR